MGAIAIGNLLQSLWAYPCLRPAEDAGGFQAESQQGDFEDPDCVFFQHSQDGAARAVTAQSCCTLAAIL